MYSTVSVYPVFFALRLKERKFSQEREEIKKETSFLCFFPAAKMRINIKDVDSSRDPFSLFLWPSVRS